MKKKLAILTALTLGLVAVTMWVTKSVNAQISSGYDALDKLEQNRQFGFSAPAKDVLATNLGYRILGPTTAMGVAGGGPPVILLGAYMPSTNTTLKGSPGNIFINTLGGTTNTFWVYENATAGLTNGWINK